MKQEYCGDIEEFITKSKIDEKGVKTCDPIKYMHLHHRTDDRCLYKYKCKDMYFKKKHIGATLNSESLRKLEAITKYAIIYARLLGYHISNYNSIYFDKNDANNLLIPGSIGEEYVSLFRRVYYIDINTRASHFVIFEVRFYPDEFEKYGATKKILAFMKKIPSLFVKNSLC